MMKCFTDALGNAIKINYPPQRIISIVPSQTELLFDLGLDKELIGITKFCIHPAHQFAKKQKIGGTKKLNIQAIIDLKPDLIIGNKEENTKEDIDTLSKLFPVWMSDIYTLGDAQNTISQIGELVNREPEAAYLNHLITAGFRDLNTLALERNINRKTLYLIWNKPYMAAGTNNFIHDIMLQNGMQNVIEQARYPELTDQDIVQYNPDLVLLSSEPYPFKNQHVEALQTLLPNAQIKLVDGEMFSWYGSRLVKAVQYFFEFQKTIAAKNI